MVKINRKPNIQLVSFNNCFCCVFRFRNNGFKDLLLIILFRLISLYSFFLNLKSYFFRVTIGGHVCSLDEVIP